MFDTLDHLTCLGCGLRGTVPRGPDNYQSPRMLVREVGDLPEAARECPRCGGYLHWHASPVYAPYQFDEIEQAYAVARLSVDAYWLAWRMTPMRHDGAMDFAFAAARTTPVAVLTTNDE